VIVSQLRHTPSLPVPTRPVPPSASTAAARPLPRWALVAGTTEGQPRQVQPGRPAGGPLDQQLDIRRAEGQSEAAVQETVGLLDGEAQVVGPELEQVSVSPESGEREVRFPSGREHQTEGGRRMLDQPSDALTCATTGEQVEVVDDQGHGGLFGEGVRQPRQEQLDHGDPRHRFPECAAHVGTHPAQRLDQVGPQHRRIVVVPVKAQPGDRASTLRDTTW
jgi:hypothetical protein